MIQSGSHFYDQEGNPRYEIDLRGAKKNDDLPSVTTVMKIVYKAGLEKWIQEQMILAALTTKRNKDENDQDFVKRITESGREESSSAADFGGNIHEGIDKKITETPINYDKMSAHEVVVLKNFEQSIIKPNLKKDTMIIEKEYINLEYGYGCRVDAHGEYKNVYSVIDWKTQGIKWKAYKRSKPDDPYQYEKDGLYYRPVPNFYDEWLWQLGACFDAVNENQKKKIEQGVSVIINSDPNYPNMFFEKIYTREELYDGLETFLFALNLYRKIKKFPYNRRI
jgi:hypothetical protein